MPDNQNNPQQNFQPNNNTPAFTQPGNPAPAPQPVPAQQPPSVVTNGNKNSAKPKKPGNPLTIVVILLCLLLMLAIGAIITLLFLNNQNTDRLNTDISGYLTEIDRQKDEKNQIRDIWEEQAASNDKLIVSQDNVITQLQDYLAEVNKTFRFIEGQPQLLETADKARYDQSLEDLNTELENLSLDAQESIDLKATNKNKIDTIYLQGFEDQSNRANPDGLR